MNRLHWLALLLLTLELAGGAYWWQQKRAVRRPPEADWRFIDPLAAEQISALRESCRSAEDWRRLGECHMAYGYFLEAEACHRQAATLAPRNAEFAYQWAFALERLGLLEDSIAQYEQAVQFGHRHADECWYLVGRNYLRVDNADRAAAAFEKAGRLAAARYERARLLSREGCREEAVAIVEALAQEFPSAGQPHQLRDRLERLVGPSPPKDVVSDRAALARTRLPNPFDRPFERLMKTYNQFGVSAVAKECERSELTYALEEKLRDAQRRYWTPSAADLLAEGHFQRRQLDDASRLVQEVLDRDVPSAHYFIRLGDVQEAKGDMSEAMALWHRAAALGWPADVKDVHAKLHQTYTKAGRHELAKQHLAQAYYGAGLEAFWNDDLAKARDALQLAVEQQPGHASAWLYLGDACRLLRKTAEARTAYERCLALRHEDSRAQRGLRLLP